MTSNTLLDVRDLTVEFMTRRGIVKAVQHVNITIAKGETVGIVGESGSGKSVTSYAVMRILDRAGKIADGSITFSGIDVKDAPEREMRAFHRFLKTLGYPCVDESRNPAYRLFLSP